MINLKNISKSFGNRIIFKDFSYTFPKKGIVAIVGESGSGKSTLLNLICGLDFSYDGEAKILDKNLKDFNDNQLRNFRIKNIGYVFQNFNLLNLASVFENVCLPLDTISNQKRKIKKQRVEDCLKLVGIEKLSKQSINKLSGGEKQRVAIARSIINDPPIILCDEPTGALDEKNSEMVFSNLQKISADKLVIIATHDIESIEKIANEMLIIKDQKITKKHINSQVNLEKPILLGVEKKIKESKVTSAFKIKYAFQKIKAKKFRSLIVNIMLSLSLAGIGLSLIISNSVSQKVNDAFQSILNGNQLIMSLENENENTFTNTFSASYSNVNKVYEKYKYQLSGIGVNYIVNFEDFFKDKNDVKIETKNKSFSFPVFSSRNINDFKYLEEYQDNIYYPSYPELLDDDQIVLGLTYNDMVNLCFQLQIQRNFTTLGHFIYENNLFLTLKVANSYWQYDDDQIFKIVGVCESSVSSFYHSNILWNEIVFEEMMRLPSDDDSVHEFPWEMYKIYYLKTIENPEIFLNSIFYDEEFTDFVFERSSFSYNPILCKPNNICNEKRVYVYLADKYSINPSVINELVSNNIDVNNYFFTTDFGYASYSSNLFSGFSKNVFISNDEELVNKAIDADTQLNRDTNISVDLPENVIEGNFLNSLGNGLRFSTLNGKLMYGRKASNLNEIVISKGLGEKLDKTNLCLGKYLTFAGEIEEYFDLNGNLIKEYNTAKLLVVGIVNESKNYFYHNNNWTISFFRDKLGVSNFYLIPRSIIFEFCSEDEAAAAISKMSQVITQYKFTNPINEVKQNISSTLDYANTILLVFSVLSTIISILLLGTVLMLNIIESKDEIELFKFIGIKRKDVNSCFVYQGLVQGFLAFLVSAFELISVDIAISYFLGDFLNIGFKFSFISVPMLVVFLMSILMPLLVSKLILIFVRKEKKV